MRLEYGALDLVLGLGGSAGRGAGARDRADRGCATRDPRRGPAARARGKRQIRTPYEPNALERGMRLAEERVTRLLAGPDGLHPKIGSLTTGSGFAFGAGYRNRRLFDREGAVTAWVAGSLKKYWAVEGRFDLPDLAGGRLTIGTYARRNNYPQEDFFGMGPEALRGDHSNFRVPGHAGRRSRRGKARADRHVRRRSGIYAARSGTGRNSALPTIERAVRRHVRARVVGREQFCSHECVPRHRLPAAEEMHGAAAGTGSMPATTPRNPTRSRSAASTRISVSMRAFSPNAECSRCDCLSRRPTRPLAPACPFYLMPSLGGHDSLRGFRDYRFRGPHAHSDADRVPLGDLVGFRRGAVLRCRQGRTAPLGAQFQKSRRRIRIRISIQHRQRHDSANRRRVRQPRRQASLYCVRRCLLIA